MWLYIHTLDTCFWYQSRHVFLELGANNQSFTSIDNWKTTITKAHVLPQQYARLGLNEVSYIDTFNFEQGKSEGFESCDRPIVRKRPFWVKIGDVLYRVTLKFDGWPWKTKGHLSFAVSSFVQHFIAIGEFKLELQSGNAQFGSNLMIFRAVWPWNSTDDLEK